MARYSAHEIPKGEVNFFNPPHGGRPPSDEAVHKATIRYLGKNKEAVERSERAYENARGGKMMRRT